MTWPFPDRLGVPLDPNVDRHHWLDIDGDVIAAHWDSDGTWMWGDRVWTPDHVALSRWGYHGPCLTPDEVRAKVTAGRLAERKDIASKIGALLREARDVGEKGKTGPADNGAVIMLITLAEMLPKAINDLPPPIEDAP